MAGVLVIDPNPEVPIQVMETGGWIPWMQIRTRVDGYLGTVPLQRLGVIIFCDEDGEPLRLEANHRFTPYFSQVPLRGTLVITGYDANSEGEPAALTGEKIGELLAQLTP